MVEVTLRRKERVIQIPSTVRSSSRASSTKDLVNISILGYYLLPTYLLLLSIAFWGVGR